MQNRQFIFTWHENTKYNAPIIRNNTITVVNADDDLGHVAHYATNLFCSKFGSLKKNTIVSIQEIDSNNNPIGEPIVPMDDSAIVPSVR